MQLSLIETGTNINPKIPRSIKMSLVAASVFIRCSGYLQTVDRTKRSHLLPKIMMSGLDCASFMLEELAFGTVLGYRVNLSYR
jgi:hypothetical protein